MACQLFVTSIASDNTQTTRSQRYSDLDAALSEAAKKISNEKARRKANRNPVILIDLRIECDNGNVLNYDDIRRVHLFHPD